MLRPEYAVFTLAAFPLLAQQESGPNPAVIVVAVLLILVLLAAPLIYLLIGRPGQMSQSLLFVSTDESAQKLVKSVARKTNYNVVMAYRYEDALVSLREDGTLTMIIMDDSVPQSEAGLLLSTLSHMPVGVRPLILIQDSSELGLTTPAYRAEVLLTRPLTEKALEAAIRQVSEKFG